MFENKSTKFSENLIFVLCLIIFVMCLFLLNNRFSMVHDDLRSSRNIVVDPPRVADFQPHAAVRDAGSERAVHHIGRIGIPVVEDGVEQIVPAELSRVPASGRSGIKIPELDPHRESPLDRRRRRFAVPAGISLDVDPAALPSFIDADLVRAPVHEDQVIRAAVVALCLDVHRGHLGPAGLVEPDAVDLRADRACAVWVSVIVILPVVLPSFRSRAPPVIVKEIYIPVAHLPGFVHHSAAAGPFQVVDR